MRTINIQADNLNPDCCDEFQSYFCHDLTMCGFNFEIKVDDKCPLCGYGLDMKKESYRCWYDIFDNKQTEFSIICLYVCDHCHKGFVVIHHMAFKNDVIIEKSQSVCPSCFAGLQKKDDIYNISPDFYKIYEQCLIAKSKNLTELYGQGFRKAIEQLVTDYAILENPNDKEKILKMHLHDRIEKYFNKSDAKEALMACKWIGNNETHYDNHNSEEDLFLLEELIDDVIHYISRELRRKQAIRVNNINGKRGYKPCKSHL